METAASAPRSWLITRRRIITGWKNVRSEFLPDKLGIGTADSVMPGAWRRGLWLALMVFLMGACSGATRQVDVATPDETFVYECRDGYQFVASLEESGLWLFLPQETVRLSRRAAGEPTVFENDEIVFRRSETQASLAYRGTTHTSCLNNHAKAIWEHAKLGGADFRAVGNEPGWTLLITASGSLELVAGYGSESYTFDTPQPISGPGLHRSEYRVSQHGHVISVVLEGRPCMDTMSGESFETAVTVIIDGTLLKGCGRALH